jgi:hypothetical protein
VSSGAFAQPKAARALSPLIQSGQAQKVGFIVILVSDMCTIVQPTDQLKISCKEPISEL